MKKILLWTAIAIPSFVFSQSQQQIDDALIILQKALQDEVNIRNDQAPGFVKPNDDLTFKEVYKKVFSTVVLGKTDAVANGSAFSYTQDNNKGTFSVNGIKTFKKFENTLFDGGLSIKSKDNSYAYYQKGKWSSDITIKFGVAIKLGGKKMYWNSKDNTEANKARSAYFEKEFQKYNQLSDVKKHITFDKIQLDSMKEELVASPSAIATKIMNAYGDTNDAAKPYHGYRISWINFNASYTNSSFAIVNDSVMVDAIQEKFSSVSKGTIESNYNFHLKDLNNFFIFQAYGRINRVSILDNVDLIDKKIKVSPIPVNDDYSLYYYNSDIGAATHFASYSDIHRPVVTVDYGFNFAFLKPFEQQLGINAKVNFTTPYGDNDYNFSRNYSVLFGPIIRLAKDKIFSAATFTINLGFENAKYTENAWDRFVVKASAAIPFNVFEKSK
ncbi:hypothetical protein [Flavobacterium microcysteis]